MNRSRIAFGAVAALALLGTLLFVLSRGGSSSPAADPSGDDGAIAEPEQPRASLLRAVGERLIKGPEQPGAGTLTIRGKVIAPSGSAKGAWVVATLADKDDALSSRVCDCDNHCGQRLLDCGCSEAAQQLVEQVTNRAGEVVPVAEAGVNDEGEFELTGLEPGSVALWAELSNTGVGLLPEVSAGAEGVEIRLLPGRSLHGTVVSEDGAGLAGVSLTAVNKQESKFFDALSDADGHFGIGPIPDGEYRIVAWDGVHLAAQHDSGRGSDKIKLVLNDPRTLSGRVLQDGLPVAGAAVELEGEHKKAQLETGADGGFAFAGLHPGSYEVLAKKGSKGGAASVSLRPRVPPPIEIELGALSSVEGVVRDTSGAPIEGVNITAHKGQWSWERRQKEPERNVYTSANGRYHLDLPQGAWNVGAAKRRYLASDWSPTTLAPGQSATRDFTLRPASVVRGVVVDRTGQPIAEAMVTSVEKGGDPYGPRDASDESGAFVLDLEPGPRQLRVQHQRHRSATLEVTAPSEDVRVVLETGGVVTGVVLDFDGKPIGGAYVMARLEGQRQDGWPGFVQPQMQSTASNGRFELAGLEPGPTSINAQIRSEGDGPPLSIATVLEVRLDQAQDVVLQPKQGKTIAGTVIDQSGKPVPRLLVYARSTGKTREAEPALGYLQASSDAAGHFVLEHATADEYELNTDRERYTPAERTTAKPGDKDVRLVVKQRATARGRVLDPSGQPVTHFSLDTHETEAADGVFHYPVDSDFMSPLNVAADGYASVQVPVEIKPGAEVDLGDIVLGGGRDVRGMVVDAANGKPVASVRIVLDPGYGPMAFGARAERLDASAISDNSGRFKLSHLPDADAIVALIHDDYGTTVSVIARGDEHPTLSIQHAGAIVGRIVRADGSGISTRVYAIGSENGAYKMAQSDEAGAFRMLLSAGEYMLRTDGQEPIETKVVKVPPSGEVKVELGERRGTRLRLRLLAVDGTPSSNFAGLVPGTLENAAFDPAKMGSLMASMITPKAPMSATPEFEGVPAGPYTLVVIPMDSTSPRMLLRPLQVSGESEQSLDIRVDPAEMRGFGP